MNSGSVHRCRCRRARAGGRAGRRGRDPRRAGDTACRDVRCAHERPVEPEAAEALGKVGPGADGSGPRPESLGGLLTTASRLLFGGGPSNHVIAYDAADGRILWHSGLTAQMSNTPITYMLDGVQYLVVAAGDTVYAFSLQR